MANRSTWFADRDTDTLVLAVDDEDGYDGSCLRYARLSDPSVTTWYSCDYKPAAVSRYGSFMITYDIEADGLGASSVYLRQTDGALLHTYRTGLFGSVGFDRRNSLVLSAQARRRAAVTLCDSDGDCTRATAARRVRDQDLGPDAVLKFSLAP
ncbi:hypothetical protein BH24ACT12_BH24ACT12_22180 [soil metagenome]